MQVVSTLIDFLMRVMSDEETRAAFERDPQGTLERFGLDGVTGPDVRDACLVMADGGGVRSRTGELSGSGSDDPVREIHHTTRNYEVTDQNFNFVNIDDRDTLINDSFNTDDHSVDGDVSVVAIQDNDTDVDIVDIEDSFNEETPAPVAEETPEVTEPDEPDEEPAVEEPAAAIPTPVENEPVEEEQLVDGEPDLDAAIV